MLRGTAQNPDVFFQAREACNPFYAACPDIVQQGRWTNSPRITGRQYKLFDYVGAPDAERVHRADGFRLRDGARDGGVSERARRESRRAQGAAVSAIRRASALWRRCRRRVKTIAVLDRTKEPGATGEPLYQDVVTALIEGTGRRLAASSKAMPKVVGGRYGLSSKEFTPAMVKAVFDNLAAAKPKNHFTVGINDDVTHTSLPVRPRVLHRVGQGRPRVVLRPGRGRHGGRQQELHQDHRRGHRQLRAGLFRV